MTPLLPSTGAPVRDHRNAVRNRSESLAAFHRNHWTISSESATNEDEKARWIVLAQKWLERMNGKPRALRDLINQWRRLPNSNSKSSRRKNIRPGEQSSASQ